MEALTERIRVLELENGRLRRQLAAAVCGECSKQMQTPSPAARPDGKSPRDKSPRDKSPRELQGLVRSSPRSGAFTTRPPLPSAPPSSLSVSFSRAATAWSRRHLVFLFSFLTPSTPQSSNL
jgi:hypothetical protein